MSENGPPKLRKPGKDNQKEEGSSKFKKPDTNIREKLSSLNLKKHEKTITNTVSSIKSKTQRDKEDKKGPLKIRTPPTEGKEKSRSKNLKETSQILRNRPILSFIGVIILIILIVAVALWAMGDQPPINSTNNSTNQTTIQKNHFANGNISFDYPEGWNVTNNSNNSNSQYTLITTVSKDENNSFSIFRQALGNQNFTYLVGSWRSNILKNGMIYYEGDLTIDNTTAYELEANYKPSDKVFTTRGIAFQKNDSVYFIIFVFDRPLLDFKNEMDKVINSFHVIERPQK